MKKLFAILLSVMMIFGLVGCGNSTNQPTTGGDTTEKVSIAVIVPQKRGDLGFTDSIYSGVEAVKNNFGDKVEITFSECAGDSSKFESTIYDTCDQNPDLVITPAGSGFADLIATKAAHDYPEIDFYLVDANAAYTGITTDNVTALSYKQNEATFLTGALAALLNETGTIGYVAGMSNAVINDFTVGYIQGAQYINPEIKVLISYIGDFQDSAKAKELAATQIGLGADVVSQVAGTAGLGVLSAAKENGVWGIGVDSDQSAAYKSSDPEMSACIASSAIKNGAQMLESFVKRYLEGDSTIPWGGIESQGLVEGAVEIAAMVDGVSAEIQQQVKDLEAKVVNGEVKVESAFDITEDAFNAYVESCQ